MVQKSGTPRIRVIINDAGETTLQEMDMLLPPKLFTTVQNEAIERMAAHEAPQITTFHSESELSVCSSYSDDEEEQENNDPTMSKSGSMSSILRDDDDDADDEDDDKEYFRSKEYKQGMSKPDYLKSKSKSEGSSEDGREKENKGKGQKSTSRLKRGGRTPTTGENEGGGKPKSNPRVNLLHTSNKV